MKQWDGKKPEFIDCEENKIVHENAFSVSYATVHPQWGGYCSPAVVTISKKAQDEDPACFNVANFHNGEFPDDNSMNIHYCMATQVISFGIEVLEMQKKHQEGIDLKDSRLQEFIGRLNRLLNE